LNGEERGDVVVERDVVAPMGFGDLPFE